MDKYINPFTDFGFKKLFGTEANKDLLAEFLQALLQKEGKISKLSYLNNAQLGNTVVDRGAIFDIYCETDLGEKFIVEMQKAKQKYFKDRSLFYSTFPIQEQAQQGDWDFKLNPVYTIGILDFVFEEDKKDESKYVYRVQLSDNETHKVFYDKLTFVYMEMPKFNKRENELETVFDKWMFVLKNLSRLQERPKALQDRIFKKLFKIAEIEQFTPQERKAYDNSLKHYRDMQNVINTAVEEAVEKAVKEKTKEKDNVIQAQEEALKTQEEALKTKDEALKTKDEALKTQTEALKSKDEALKAQAAREVLTVKKLLAMGLSQAQIVETTGIEMARIAEIVAKK